MSESVCETKPSTQTTALRHYIGPSRGFWRAILCVEVMSLWDPLCIVAMRVEDPGVGREEWLTAGKTVSLRITRRPNLMSDIPIDVLWCSGPQFGSVTTYKYGGSTNYLIMHHSNTRSVCWASFQYCSHIQIYISLPPFTAL